MDGRAPGGRSRGFTLTELITVLGLVALLVALFLPVVGRMRSAAGAATCLSNLRQIGTAWTMAVSVEHGRLFDYSWNAFPTPDAAWNGYWLGAVDRYKVNGATLLCPDAAEPGDASRNGYGSAGRAWTGQYDSNGTVIKKDDKTYRTGSYGYNRWLGGGQGFGAGEKGGVRYLSDLRNPAAVPVFLDCTYADVWPTNGTGATPVESPPDLSGSASVRGAPEHWKVTLARHGRGVNAYHADGSASWVMLDDLYLEQWNADWVQYRLKLPRE
jgi:prepilin-type N-terminal cleavage/methylation domain-containing protein/prepilin-type processing-associated H-X9-DG protein